MCRHVWATEHTLRPENSSVGLFFPLIFPWVEWAKNQRQLLQAYAADALPTEPSSFLKVSIKK